MLQRQAQSQRPLELETPFQPWEEEPGGRQVVSLALKKPRSVSSFSKEQRLGNGFFLSSSRKEYTSQWCGEVSAGLLDLEGSVP